MLPPCVDLIWAIISRDSQNSCRKKQKHGSRVWVHWKKHNTAKFAIRGSWTGILENCPDIHPYEKDMNLVLYPSTNFPVWPSTSHLRSSEVKRHPPIHSKALLTSCRLNHAAFPREPKSLLPCSCLFDLKVLCDSVCLLRKDNCSQHKRTPGLTGSEERRAKYT